MLRRDMNHSACSIRWRSAARASWLILTYLALSLTVNFWLETPRSHAEEAQVKPTDPVAHPDFAGSNRCAQCHAAEHNDWLSSQHAVAMQEATEQTVLGRFDGTTFSNENVTSKFYKSDGKFWVRTDGPDAALGDFEISYTFGVWPLQQYLIKLPGGRFQALGIAWDARSKEDGGQRWFHLYPDRKLKAGDPLHWTGIDQNWNYQCAWCHSTNIKKNYDQTSGSFRTTWSEISVGCEACHGPGSEHVAWATRSNGWQQSDQRGKGFAQTFDERKGVTWPMDASGQAHRSAPRTSANEIHVCAGCHSRRQQFSDDPGSVGRLFDAFRPSLLEDGLYHVDGQQRDEVYNYGSFLESRMHSAGVTCSDCHNPHTGKLRQTGNSLCGQCHEPERFDVSAHHHHAPNSKGAECAACHMPVTTYMGIDGRRDHSIRIPRPDRTVLLGTPNACNQCHTDKSAKWAMDAVKAWYPSPKPGFQDFAEAFDRGDWGAPGAQPGLIGIAKASTEAPIARASAIARLRRFPSPQVLDFAASSLKIDDPQIRAAAVSVIAGAAPETRRSLLAPSLRDETRLVRMDAARAIAGEAEQNLSADDRASFEKALAEYIDAQMFNAERPESHANLGTLYRDRGKLSDARAAFARAIEIDPTFVPAVISLAELKRGQDDEIGAEAVLRKSLDGNPRSGGLWHALGLSLIRQKRLPEAMAALAKAAELAPEDPRFSYVYGVALHDTGKPREAVEALKSALTRHPYDRDILWALAKYEIEAGDDASALARAELLNHLEPERSDIAQLLGELRQRTR
ncbi:tetratricopeptide repeat protein [Hyphomicrobium facile]|uniref:tetratricopeptide repeat protein n=1 Tax=Hyphomicrobium facile TaxID=51670 RepID=UPI001FCD8A49|nr:tetratricopeptide repeat protein [Hyphomicrobium facile]